MANLSRLQEIRKIRLEKLEKLRALKVDPYPAKFSKSITPITEVRSMEGKSVSTAGRLWRWREHGNAIFTDLRDESGQIQLLFQKKNLEKKWDILKLLDVGDFLGVEGQVTTTSAGEVTIDVINFELLTKSIRPLPDEWFGLKDIEERYRKRYLDMLMDPNVKKVFDIRTTILKETRSYLDSLGFKEVETPIFHALYGGANAKPFITHMHALDQNFYLRIAFELYLKRLVVGGYEKVYEIGRDFRNEGFDHSHNPEFTMMEWYEAYADYHRVMDVAEGLLKHLAMQIFGHPRVQVGELTVDIGQAWPRITMASLLQDRLKVDVDKVSEKELISLTKKYKLEITGGETKGQLIFLLFDKLISKTLVEPIWVIDYPADISPLSKPHPNKPEWVERFEGYIGGREILDGWSELTDPQVQRQRWEFDQKAAREDKVEAQQTDEDFLEAMEYGMPPLGGIGVGMDRLTAFFANKDSLKEVILFPTLRSEDKSSSHRSKQDSDQKLGTVIDADLPAGKIMDTSHDFQRVVTRDQAIELLYTHVKNLNLRRHCLAVGETMKALAQKLGGDPETWEILGLIHDSDWEETKDTPEKHTLLTLKRVTEEPFVHALKSHNTKLTHLADLEGKMEWALECCDELTGFIVAVALVRPDKKLATIEVDSVLKKFPNKEFAKPVDRSQISQCEEKLGIPLREFVQITLSAMQQIAPDLGL